MQWYPLLLEWNPGDPKIFWDVVHGNRKNSKGDNWYVVALALTVGKEIQILATLRITSRPRNTNQLLWRNTDVALQEIREIQMQPVKLSTNSWRGLDLSYLDHNRFALGFKLADYDAHVHSDVTTRVSILAIHCSVRRRIMFCTNILGLGAEHSFTIVMASDKGTNITHAHRCL